MPSLGNLQSGCIEILSPSAPLDVPIRFWSLRLCLVQCELGPLSQIPVHRLSRQRIQFSVQTSIKIGTIVRQVVAISQQVFWKSLPPFILRMGAVPESENYIRIIILARCIIVCVQVGSGFALSLDHLTNSIKADVLYTSVAPHAAHQLQCRIANSQIINWCISLDHVFWWNT